MTGRFEPAAADFAARMRASFARGTLDTPS